MKTLPSGVLAALEEGRFFVRVLLKAELVSGDAGVWNGAHAITHNALIYKPLGGNMEIEGIPGSGELSADRVRVTFSGLDPDALALVTPGEWHQRRAVVMVAYLDEGEIIAHVEPVFTGFIDQSSQADASDATATLVVTLESNNRELDRSSGRTYSDADQRAHGGPDDGYLKHVAASNADDEIYWGHKGPQKASGGLGSGGSGSTGSSGASV